MHTLTGTRYGGSVTTEEYGHTIFDVAISAADPQGWRAVQKAAKLARVAQSRTPDADWDCYTSATEYFAGGVELLLYNTRIGTNLGATTRAELKAQDVNLWCLVNRFYENNNQWRCSFSLCCCVWYNMPACVGLVQTDHPMHLKRMMRLPAKVCTTKPVVRNDYI